MVVAWWYHSEDDGTGEHTDARAFASAFVSRKRQKKPAIVMT